MDLYVSKTAKRIAAEILTSKEADDRQRLSNELLFELDQLSEIQPCRVEIVDAKQRHRKKAGRLVYKEYGHYKPVSNSIHITNKTAIRQQILAPKTFLDTLLHEWMHHYDTHKLRLNSIHSKGFYCRLAHLKGKLLD